MTSGLALHTMFCVSASMNKETTLFRVCSVNEIIEYMQKNNEEVERRCGIDINSVLVKEEGGKGTLLPRCAKNEIPGSQSVGTAPQSIYKNLYWYCDTAKGKLLYFEEDLEGLYSCLVTELPMEETFSGFDVYLKDIHRVLV
eukprot:1410051-Rhodomonas_salina.3